MVDLKNHRENASPQDCTLCEQRFCTPSDYKQHWIVVHKGGAVESPEDEEYSSILKQTINPPTVLQNNKDYEEIIEKNKHLIKDNVNDRTVYMTVNKELNPGFTYEYLRNQIVKALKKHGKSAKLNIGFGFVLKHNITGEYRYYYPSTNTMLFNIAKTISKMSDVKDIVKEMYDINIAEHYYMMRPSSSWTLVRITNVLFKLYNLSPILE